MWASTTFGWAPSTVREQSYRDLMLLYDAMIARG